ncbi:hypothetical protein COZ60_00265 [Candidatus Bathyarchaeota archaeon CG_4_8_14_3_um_filter_42_8]|nr:MAG: hypothetical protein COZ60_00265 [Candidatus Bathyarchaeota archaeon CG_4_8_14_3_um_filter_42_8]
MLQNELIVSSDGLGAKYGALNYLACVRNDETDASNEPGITQCERKNLWEQIYITTQECNISTNNTGNIAYRIYEEDDETEGWKYSAYYPDICLHPDSRSILYCKRYIRTDPVYCIGNVTTKKGYITGTYELNKTDEYGNLEVHKSQIGACKELNGAYHFGNVNSCTLFYTTNEIWLNNDNEYISGYEDRTGDFYDSIIYRGIFLDELDGFEKIYDNAYVKIYQITKRLYI